jgi:hypothetical protein
MWASLCVIYIETKPNTAAASVLPICNVHEWIACNDTIAVRAGGAVYDHVECAMAVDYDGSHWCVRVHLLKSAVHCTTNGSNSAFLFVSIFLFLEAIYTSNTKLYSVVNTTVRL